MYECGCSFNLLVCIYRYTYRPNSVVIMVMVTMLMSTTIGVFSGFPSSTASYESGPVTKVQECMQILPKSVETHTLKSNPTRHFSLATFLPLIIIILVSL